MVGKGYSDEQKKGSGQSPIPDQLRPKSQLQCQSQSQLQSQSQSQSPGETTPEALIRVRVSQADAHYGGGLVAGAKIMEYFGDVATELCIRHDGDEGLFASYDRVEFKRPVYAGDFLEIHGRITQVGRRSRKVELEAYKIIRARYDISPSKAEVLSEPILVAWATGTVVVPEDALKFETEPHK